MYDLIYEVLENIFPNYNLNLELPWIQNIVYFSKISEYLLLSIDKWSNKAK